jgi:hypothetical protein
MTVNDQNLERTEKQWREGIEALLVEYLQLCRPDVMTKDRAISTLKFIKEGITLDQYLAQTDNLSKLTDGKWTRPEPADTSFN